MKDECGPLYALGMIIRFCNSIRSAMERFGNDEEDFLGDELYQNSCCFALIQIGEYVKKLPKEITKEHPDIEWSEFAGLRDFIAHSYHKTNMHRIWIIMTEDIPLLKPRCETILDELKNE
ncbi:MAG: DUF86 domain-containing protein [Methanomassiliicoccaceae archaeon]|nr:DUF86 domain-containing protein [Methanomassiliicoccaceae archaeon]